MDVVALTSNSGRLEAALAAELEAFLAAAAALDGHGACVQFDHALNAQPSPPDWYLAREGGALLGLLSVFAPLREEPELSLLVAPAARRRGLGRALVREASAGLEAAGFGRPLLVADRRSPTGAAFIAALGAEAHHSEYSMRLPPGRARGAAGPARIGRLALRRARPEDIPRMAAIASASFGESPAEAEGLLRANLAAEGREQWVALDGDLMVGVAALGLEAGAEGEAAAASINGVAVPPELRGRGHGRALMEALLAEIGSRGLRAELEVDSLNARARALSLSLGFEDLSATDYARLPG